MSVTKEYPLKQKLISDFYTHESGLNGLKESSFHAKRKEALKVFEEKGFPTTRDEEWKYTSLAPVVKHDYELNAPANLTGADLSAVAIEDLKAVLIVIENGRLNEELSDLSLLSGTKVIASSFEKAVKEHKNLVDEYFTALSAKSNDGTVSLNTAFSQDGLFLYVPDNTIVEYPVRIVYTTSKTEGNVLNQPRNLIIAGKNSQLKVIEQFHANVKGNAWTNVVTEIQVEQDAILHYYKIQNDIETASAVDNTFLKQAKNSITNFYTFSFGGKLVRNTLNIELGDERCEAHLYAVTLTNGNQLVDHHTFVDHAFPNCYSNELYKGVYDGKSNGVFNGKIMVRQDAQQTNAFQSNGNILLSDKASIDTKPQLEIFADDVKCSHGATVGQLDEQALFYMRSRGIAEKEAKSLLVYAFVHEVVEKIKDENLHKYISNIIKKKLDINV